MAKPLTGNYLYVKHIETGMIGIVVVEQRGTGNWWVQPERGPGLTGPKSEFQVLGRKTVKNWKLHHPSRPIENN